jgi:hypothetical protein
MKTSIVLWLSLLLIYSEAHAQAVGIGTASPNASALLEVSSSNKGVLVPRVSLSSLVDGATIPSPATSLLVYNTNLALAGGAGYFYNSGTHVAPSWVKMLTSTSTGWSLTGNAGIDPAINFVGTTDNKRLLFRVSNQPSGWIDNTLGTTFFGYQAGKSFTFGSNSGSTGFGYNVMTNFIGARNVAVGSSAMANNGQFGYLNTAVGFEALFNNSNGSANVAIGNTSMRSNLLGDHNVAVGDSAMFTNTDGGNNTAIGANALKKNLTGNNNLAVGIYALENSTSSSLNTAIGISSMRNNISGSGNTAVGYASLSGNNTGIRNTAVGYNAMDVNTSGEHNVAMGYGAMGSNTSGFDNTAIGYIALNGNETGDYNVAVGKNALANANGNGNTAVGFDALRNDNNSVSNVAIGKSALFTQSYTNGGSLWGGNNIAIGVEALYSNQPNNSLNLLATNGIRNVAIGNYSLRDNTTGLNNTAIGHESLHSNTTGYWNNAMGVTSMYFNISGYSNVAIGNNSLRDNIDGYDNVSVGIATLALNTSGHDNTGLGQGALNQNTSGDYNTAVGSGAGSFNNANSYCTFIGYGADQTVSTDFNFSTAIGYNSRITASSQIRIGSSGTGSIGGYQPWTDLSDGRFKKNIQENVKGLEFVMSLRPVTYNLDVTMLSAHLQEDRVKDKEGKTKIKAPDQQTLLQRQQQSQVVHTGFVAQEVEAAAQKLGYDFSGVDKPKNNDDLYGLRYSEFVVPLVKGMQEQQAEIMALKERIQRLEELLKLALPTVEKTTTKN